MTFFVAGPQPRGPYLGVGTLQAVEQKLKADLDVCIRFLAEGLELPQQQRLAVHAPFVCQVLYELSEPLVTFVVQHPFQVASAQDKSIEPEIERVEKARQPGAKLQYESTTYCCPDERTCEPTRLGMLSERCAQHFARRAIGVHGLVLAPDSRLLRLARLSSS